MAYLSTQQKASASFQESKSLVSMMTPSCLHNLRFPSADKKSEPIHLLTQISEYIEDKDQSIIEELGIYNKIQKVMESKGLGESRPGHKNTKSKKVTGIQQILKVQGKMEQMRRDIENTQRTGKRHNKAVSLGKKQLKRSPLTFSTFFNQEFEASILPKEHSLQKGEEQSHLAKNSEKADTVKTLNEEETVKRTSHRLLGCHTIKKQLIEKSYGQYKKWQKNKQSEKENSIREFIEEEIVTKVNDLLEERDLKCNELLKLNRMKEQEVRQKNQEIQNLKESQQLLIQKINKLQEIRQKYVKIGNNEIRKEREIFLQNFYEEFCFKFPDENIESVHKEMERIVEKCLNKLYDVECKNKDQWDQERIEWGEELEKQYKRVEKLEEKNSELRRSLRVCQEEQNSENSKMEGLAKHQEDLKQLHRKILDLYGNWYSKLSEQEKDTMKSLGMIKGDYDYSSMLDYILFYKEKLSSEHKVYEYLIKILRGIERIRKVLMPHNDVQQDPKSFKDPLKFLQKLEKYVSKKVSQTRLKKGCPATENIDQLIDKDSNFLKSSQVVLFMRKEDNH